MSKQNILIVDDDPLMCRLFQTALRQQGYNAVALESGAEALTYLEQNAVDLLVLDMMMADIDGLQVIITLRELPVHRDLPILVLSAHVDVENKRRALNAGANEYLEKPITPERLVRHIRAVLPPIQS